MSKLTFIKYLKRILLFIILLAIHYLLVVIPVLETFLLYVIIFKPKWFEDL
jgi:DMSO/TMAO reductase YedYZ heme-binding membrane subunit